MKINKQQGTTRYSKRRSRAQTKIPVMAGLRAEGIAAPMIVEDNKEDDFAPFTLKIGRRTEKQWFCLLTNLTIWSVHREIVPKLDPDCRLDDNMRFIAQRSQPVKRVHWQRDKLHCCRVQKVHRSLKQKKTYRTISSNEGSAGTSGHLQPFTLGERQSKWSEITEKRYL